MDPLKKIREDLDAALEEAEAYTTREDFKPEDPAYVALKANAETLQRSYSAMAEWRTRKSESDKIGAQLHKLAGERETEKVNTREDNLSLGEAFIRSEVFTQYPGRGTSSRFQIKTRALPTGLTEWAAALPPAPRRDITPAYAPTTILDLVPSIPVSGNSVETIVYAKVAGAAAIVPEKGTKPLLEFAPTVTPVTLQNIAAATQLTRQLLEDAPAVRARIDGMLANEVRAKQEAEAAGALVAATIPTATADTLMAAIRIGVATVQTAGYNPSAVLLNPMDWAVLDADLFTQTNNGPVIAQRFWGLTPVAHAAQPAGTATVGDFNAGVENYTRSGINAYITDSHGDTFLENVFTILAEARSKTVVVRPAALVEVSATALPPLSRSAEAKKS